MGGDHGRISLRYRACSTVVRKEIQEPRSRLKPNAVRKHMLYIDSIYPEVYIILYIIREKESDESETV